MKSWINSHFNSAIQNFNNVYSSVNKALEPNKHKTVVIKRKKPSRTENGIGRPETQKKTAMLKNELMFESIKQELFTQDTNISLKDQIKDVPTSAESNIPVQCSPESPQLSSAYYPIAGVRSVAKYSPTTSSDNSNSPLEISTPCHVERITRLEREVYSLKSLVASEKLSQSQAPTPISLSPVRITPPLNGTPLHVMNQMMEEMKSHELRQTPKDRVKLKKEPTTLREKMIKELEQHFKNKRKK